MQTVKLLFFHCLLKNVFLLYRLSSCPFLLLVVFCFINKMTMTVSYAKLGVQLYLVFELCFV